MALFQRHHSLRFGKKNSTTARTLARRSALAPPPPRTRAPSLHINYVIYMRAGRLNVRVRRASSEEASWEEGDTARARGSKGDDACRLDRQESALPAAAIPPPPPLCCNTNENIAPCRIFKRASVGQVDPVRDGGVHEHHLIGFGFFGVIVLVPSTQGASFCGQVIVVVKGRAGPPSDARARRREFTRPSCPCRPWAAAPSGCWGGHRPRRS